jgi:uncharacterized protein (TIGR02996 family)
VKRNPDLEQPILDDPYDRNAYLYVADWLQQHGDPRGELIALEVQAEKDRAITTAANEFFTAHFDQFVGPLAEYHQDFSWRFGFIHRLRLTANRAKAYQLVRAHDSGAFIAELVVRPTHLADPDLEQLVELLVKDPPPTLRRLQLGADRDPEQTQNWFFSGTDVSRLWARLPRLRHLTVDGGQFYVGDFAFDELEVAELRTGGLQSQNARAIARARMPKLRTLVVGGDHNNSTETLWLRGGRVTVSRCDGTCSDIAPLFARTDLPALRRLSITNCLFTDDVCAALAAAPLAAQLEVLDLSWGCMTDEGARRLGAAAAAFPKLELLDVSRNYLSRTGLAALRNVARTVRASHQHPEQRP